MESELSACGPLASFSIQLASSSVTPAGSVHKFRSDNVGAVEDMMYECYKGGIVVMDVFDVEFV